MVKDQPFGGISPPTSPFGGEEEVSGLLGLQQYWNMARSRIWILVVLPALCLGAAIFYLNSAEPIYQARCRLLVETGEARLLRLEDVYDPTAGARSMDSFIATQIQLMQTHDMLARAFEELGLAEWPEFAEAGNPVGILRSGLSISQERQTFLVGLSFRSTNPELAARVANALAQFYVERLAEDTTQVSTRGLDQLRTQLRHLAETRDRARQALVDYKREHGLIDIEAARELLVEQMGAITAARIEAQLLESERIAFFGTMSKWNESDDMELQATVANALPNSLAGAFRTEIIRARAQLPDLLSRYGPTHVAVRTQNEIIQNFEAAVRQEIAVNLRSAKMEAERASMRRTMLDEEMALLGKRSLELDRILGDYRVLADTLDITEDAYRMVLKRINEVELIGAAGPQQEQRKGGLSIRESARVPGTPVWPNRNRILSMYLFAGLAAAIGINILLCLLNNTVKSSEEAQAVTGFPCLGNVPPLHDGETELSGLEKPLGPLSESFRTISTSLRLSLASRSHRCFAVTSADQGEGKTFAAFNLALTLARDGMRVLLVEADMRRPRLRKLVDQAAGETVKPGKIGLSSVLVGDTSLEDARWVLPAEKRLHVLLCGVVPPNPAELISGEGFDRFLDSARQQYDMVIIDTPPVLRVADACIVAGKGIAMIYLSRLFNAPVSDVALGARRLAMVSATVSGILVNEADIAKAGKGYGYYRYGYYRYGYGRKYGYGSSYASHREDDGKDESQNA